MTKRIIAGLLFATGCAAEVSDAGRDAPTPTTKEPRGAEVPTAKAGEPPASDEADAAPLLSWSFEPASADCNGWPVLGADAIRASPARSGSYSCKVCSDGSAADLGLVRELGAVPAGRYTLTAWVRRRVQNAAPANAIARMEGATALGLASAVTPSVSVRDEWDRLEATLDLADGASNLRVTIGAPTDEAERCLFVDDVTIVRQPR